MRPYRYGSKKIITGDDGKLRWTFELNLWRHPVMLYSGTKAMSIAALSFGILVASVLRGKKSQSRKKAQPDSGKRLVCKKSGLCAPGAV